MKVNIEDIKKLREMTKAGVSDCRSALEEANGDFGKAQEILLKKAALRADKKSDREVKAGGVFSYVHHTGRLGALVGLACETDFVAKTEDFMVFGRDLAMQAAATSCSDVEELLKSEFIKDSSKTVELVAKELIGKLGENIVITSVSVILV